MYAAIRAWLLSTSMGAHSLYIRSAVTQCTAQQYICANCRRYREREAGPGIRFSVTAAPSEPSLWERRVAELRFSMEAHGASMVVSVQGELDVTSSQRFDDCLSEAAAASDQVILDMSEVDFMDTTALAVIVTHWRRAGG